ncbi:KIN7L, partial [Symbiodinium pilosum]
MVGADRAGEGPGPGWIPALSERLFAKLQSADLPFLVGVSMLSLHREELRDLLFNGRGSMKIRSGAEGAEVPDLSWHVAESSEQVLDFLHGGLASIQVACTNMEISSSEVSSIFQVVVATSQGDCISTAILRFVDLANSDRATNPARRIKSLDALGEVVTVCCRSGSFVPYRNSRLTHLLQPSLGGSVSL